MHLVCSHLLHIIPVGDDTVLDGILQGKDTTLALSLISYVGILLAHTNHDSLVTGPSNDGGKDSPGSIISGKASLTHSGAIVHNESSNVVVTHFQWRTEQTEKLTTTRSTQMPNRQSFGRLADLPYEYVPRPPMSVKICPYLVKLGEYCDLIGYF